MVSPVFHAEHSRARGWMLTVVTFVASCGSACGGGSAGSDSSTVGTVGTSPGPVVPSFATRLDEARLTLRKGSAAAALRMAGDLTREDKASAEAWLVTASAALALGKPQEALGAANVVVELRPSEAGGWTTKGAAHRALGQTIEAEKALRRALELDPTSHAARANLAILRGLAGDWAEQAALFGAALAADPDDVEARLGLAEAYLRLKDLARAEAEVKTLVLRAPTSIAGQRLAAAIAWEREDYRQAFERAKITLKLEKTDPHANTYFEASFYIVVAARLTCVAGKRPWAAPKVAEVLQKLAEEEDLTGVETFVTLDTQYAENADVQARVGRAAGDCKATP